MTFSNKITSLFNSFWTSKWSDLFLVIFLRLDNSASKSVLVIKLASASLALNTLTGNLLNSGVVIDLSWLWSVIFFSISVIFAL